MPPPPLTKKEYNESEIRKFMTLYFTKRAERHLQTLSTLYGWSPELLEEYRRRFIQTANMIPCWVSPSPQEK